MSTAPVLGRSRRVRWLVGGAVLIVALNLLVAALDAARPSPRGPTSSSYATAPDGLAAYADLLRRSGHPVVRLRRPPSDRALDPRATLVLLDPDAVLPADAEALARFVDRGGRLVAGGAMPGDWIADLVDPAPEWAPAGPTAVRPLTPAAETAGVNRVVAGGGGTWSRGGATLPLLAGGAGADAGTLLVSARRGRGRVALLADPSPLQNRLLGVADNAALGLALAGPRGRPVHFAESVHGYGDKRGLAAVPADWLWALGGLGLAALVWIAARVRRLGPPERRTRDLPPPRRDYVDAIGATLARTRRPGEAGAPVQSAARRWVVRRAGLGPGADDAAVARAAERLGFPPDEARALTGTLRDDDDLLAAGRALARATGGTR